MKLWPIAAALVVLAAACASAPPPKPAAQPVADAGAPPQTTAPATPDAAAPAAEPETGCNEDRGPIPDCAGLQLGQCGAAEFYACPAKVGLPAEAGLRPRVAARVSACLARPAFDGSSNTCTKAVEACVREAVAASCTEDETVATCKRELGVCSPAIQALCARYLTSLAPKTREKALEGLRSQRKMNKDPRTCTFSWDLNGFPFCPYCPFQP